MLYWPYKQDVKTINAKINTILFDMDGVIVDSVPVHALAAHNVLGRYGFDLSEEEYRVNFAGRTDQAGFAFYFEQLGARAPLGQILKEKARENADLSAGNLKPYPGVVEFIRDMHDRGIALALVTGSLRSEAELTRGRTLAATAA